MVEVQAGVARSNEFEQRARGPITSATNGQAAVQDWALALESARDILPTVSTSTTPAATVVGSLEVTTG